LPEALVVGVHILNMDDPGNAAAYPHARTQVHRLVRNAMFAGETAIRPVGAWSFRSVVTGIRP
jgi:hypothetical protein